LQDTLHL